MYLVLHLLGSVPARAMRSIQLKIMVEAKVIIDEFNLPPTKGFENSSLNLCSLI